MLIKKVKYQINKLVEKFKIYVFNFLSIFYKASNKDLIKVRSKNREYLSKVGEFLPQNQYEIVDYGIPINIYKNINKSINNSITYSDLIAYLIQKIYKNSLNYLEIGVSVMKNFMQVDNSVSNSNLWAYDINPVVGRFSNLFSDLESRNEQQESKLLFSNKTQNKLTYFKGDVLNEVDHKLFNQKLNINNTQFDFILSDAMHTSEGVYSEYINLIKENLADNFIIYYDDLDFLELFETVNKIYEDLKQDFENINFYTFWINGWVGQHEKMHKNGIITTYKIDDILKKENIKLPFFKKH